MRVLKHYLRLSQENLGADFNVDIGQGTCTMKYAPKINDQLANTPQLTAMHPHQDPADAQGVLEIVWQLERMLAEISGMDEVSLHTQGGSAAIWANIAMIRAFHEANGEGEQRREVITTIFSHPSNAAAAKAAAEATGAPFDPTKFAAQFYPGLGFGYTDFVLMQIVSGL